MAFSISLPNGFSMSGSPVHYTGIYPTSVVQEWARQSQEWARQANELAMHRENIESRNYAAELDFRKSINQMISDQNLAKQQSGYAQELANLNNAAALQRTGMETDAQRYGYDNQLQSALAQVMGQQNIASMNNAANRYQTDVNARTALDTANLQGQFGLQQTLIPQQFRQQRFDTVMPLLGGILGQYAGGGMGGTGSAPSAPMYNAPAPASQPSGAAQPSGFNPNDFWHQQYANAVAQGRLPQGAPLPYSANSGQVETYLQQAVGGNPNARYDAPAAPAPMQQNPTAYGPANAYAQGGGYSGGSLAGGSQGGFTSMSSSAPGAPQQAFSQAASNQISTGPIISDRMQSQMLNSALGANAQSAAQANRNAQTTFGSRGWAPTSPALRSYQNRIGMNQMLADTQARTQIPMQAAQTNANYALQAQQGNLAAQNQRMNALSGYYNSQSNMLSPILSALVSMGS